MKTIFTDLVAERSTWKLSAQLVDEDGAGIPAASLATLLLTLYDMSSGAIINLVDAVNILNVGRGTVDTLGNVTILFVPADGQIVDDTRGSEYHVALIEWTWAGGAKEARHEVLFNVVNMQKVP